MSARRAGLLLAALLPLDNPTYDDLTVQGKTLFDAVVLWALSGSAAAH